MKFSIFCWSGNKHRSAGRLAFSSSAALVYGAITVGHIRVRSVDVLATVVDDRAGANFNAPVSYLTVKLDNGEMVRVNAAKGVDYRPGNRV